jgi:hypothetical protein
LNSITIPGTVRKIGGSAFAGCSSIATVISNMEYPCEISKDCFHNNTFFNASLRIPARALERYKSTNYWNKFAYFE